MVITLYVIMGTFYSSVKEFSNKKVFRVLSTPCFNFLNNEHKEFTVLSVRYYWQKDIEVQVHVHMHRRVQTRATKTFTNSTLIRVQREANELMRWRDKLPFKDGGRGY